ncbi:hypothetical protein ASG49_12500 [Marmoricola sp. Leaf446]|uniref:hypothetical protein n=1 Tax=Marmoricola sp. Leaf446 TaxID=1736379 RepID=UPI0006FEB93B|nr:hypothetical protein [Marmoricola sp. Leaf446]KQT91140.1 hypothetical protein ASG49_12500 [Marmoricola sp. Leaf446]
MTTTAPTPPTTGSAVGPRAAGLRDPALDLLALLLVAGGTGWDLLSLSEVGPATLVAGALVLAAVGSVHVATVLTPTPRGDVLLVVRLLLVLAAAAVLLPAVRSQPELTDVQVPYRPAAATLGLLLAAAVVALLPRRPDASPAAVRWRRYAATALVALAVLDPAAEVARDVWLASTTLPAGLGLRPTSVYLLGALTVPALAVGLLLLRRPGAGAVLGCASLTGLVALLLLGSVTAGSAYPQVASPLAWVVATSVLLLAGGVAVGTDPQPPPQGRCADPALTAGLVLVAAPALGLLLELLALTGRWLTLDRDHGEQLRPDVLVLGGLLVRLLVAAGVLALLHHGGRSTRVAAGAVAGVVALLTLLGIMVGHVVAGVTFTPWGLIAVMAPPTAVAVLALRPSAASPRPGTTAPGSAPG